MKREDYLGKTVRIKKVNSENCCGSFMLGLERVVIDVWEEISLLLLEGDVFVRPSVVEIIEEA